MISWEQARHPEMSAHTDVWPPLNEKEERWIDWAVHMSVTGSGRG